MWSMLHVMNRSREDDDEVWKALAHFTRRRILDLLFDEPRTTSALVAALDLDRHVVMAHLSVLRDAGLVLTEKRGRFRINSLNAVPIQQIHQRWVTPVSGPWAAALIAVRDGTEATSHGHVPEDSINYRKRSG